MPAKKPKVGDRVYHHGHYHEIRAVHRERTDVEGNTVKLPHLLFENGGPKDGFRVRGSGAHELVWSPRLEAWYLPGRVLARNERALAESITGAWPPAANHLAILDMLDAVDLASIDRAKLKDVVRRRKPDAIEEAAKAEASGGDPEAALDGYVGRVIEQCRTLRGVRANKEG